MKNIFLFTIISLVISLHAIIADAQTGVTRLGTNALAHNTTSGTYNTGLGYYALNANTSGNHNTASGALSLRYNTTGIHNTASGAYSLFLNTIGSSNTATGFDAMYNNTTGSWNTAFGMYSLNKNTSAHYNTAIGFAALYFNTGADNTATGAYSLYLNRTGFFNTASGFNAMYYNTTGSYNTTFGAYSLNKNTTATYNTGIGYGVLYNNTTGSLNTAVGASALLYNTTGSRNTAIGYNANVSTGTLTNATAIGYNAIVNASNKVRIGNTSVTSIGGQVGWSVFSDGRFKKNIKEDVPGLGFINTLRPVTYAINVERLNEYYNKGKELISDNAEGSSRRDPANVEIKEAEIAASNILHTGFIAQEVEEAAKKLGYEFSGVDKPQSDEGIYGLRYDNFIVPLVKAVQELSKQNEDLQKQIDLLKKDMKSVSAQRGPASLSSAKVTLSNASLEQNIPNPLTTETSIRYSLPADAITGMLVITDNAGKVIKQVKVNKGRGVVIIGASSLSSGIYNYTLIVDGKSMDTKKMVVAK
jgi:trimeric autotransporter adhesin